LGCPFAPLYAGTHHAPIQMARQFCYACSHNIE
jgi:hypothetical protein